MQRKYEKIMQEVDGRIATIDLNGKNIVADSRAAIQFLKEKLNEMKSFLLSHPFENESEEILFFKHQKPMLLGRLIYFYKIYKIESHRPSCNDLAEEYYMKRQEELKLFFDRHVGFYQYYRSGATYRDDHYFLRGNQEVSCETETYDFQDEPEFSTGYDRLVARIIATEMLYAHHTTRRRTLSQPKENELSSVLLKEYCWTDKKAAAVELIYALHNAGSINNGQLGIIELVNLFETVFHIDLSNVYHTFKAIRERKINRTVYLDFMKERLLKRLEDDDTE